MDLSMASSEELVDELANRYDALVVMGYIDMDESRVRLLKKYSGGEVVVAGLIARAQMEQANGANAYKWGNFPSDDANESPE